MRGDGGHVTTEFRVLGPVEVRRDGERVALGGPQQRRMLATLLGEAGRTVPIDRLVEAVWPEDPPEGARRTVMTYVSRLRSVLDDGVIVTEGAGYRLEVEAQALDSFRFERLVERSRQTPPTQTIAVIDEALAMWHGDAYGEFAGEWWALPQATRLEELRLVAAEHQAEALLAVGDHERAISDLERLVGTNPLRGKFAELLVRAYAAADRPAEALRAAQTHREHLAEHTGLTPPDSFVQLERSILAGSSPPVAAPGQPLRGYLLGEVIGEGGFGTVYRSVQPGVDREVAVKVIRPELADAPEFVRRFELEAQLVARLEHPHVVPLYDFWREPGGAYLVFRLLRGGTAAEAREAGPWPLERATRLLEEIGGALSHAHVRGVLHRDVKPANVLFDEEGNSYLADFGIATVGSAVPKPRSLDTSPRYSPPEHLEGLEGSEASDQYSLALIVWELLTGASPYRDDEPVSELLEQKRRGPLPALTELRAELPAVASAVLQRATASRPTARFPDVAAFVAAWRDATSAHVRAPSAGGAERAESTASSMATNPYVGLRAFGEADAGLFFGRDALADHLTNVVSSSPMTAIVGASGSGKSSLLHAGLVPRLRRGEERVATMVPGEDPVAQLRLALLAVATREPKGPGPAEAIRSVAGQGAGSLTVVIDQFEELWTLTPDPDRELFLGALAALLDSDTGGGRVRLVVAIRADFYDRPLADPLLGPHVAAHSFPVTPMAAAELHEAVTRPATASGMALEDGLASEIVAEVLAHRAGLPLLQFTMAELYARQGASAVLTREAYHSLGGISGALAVRAEQVYGELSYDEQTVARRLLLRLVVPGEGVDDTRRRLRRSELPFDGATVADRLGAQRLLVGDRDPATREPTVELAHESLLREWPRLERWLDEDREVRVQLQHLEAAARGWDRGGRPESELYRGGRLETAGELARSRPEDLGELDVEFVQASEASAERSRDRDHAQRRRLRRALVGTAAALVVAVLAAVLAVMAQDEADQRAEDADLARLVSTSQSLVASKRDVAALLAVAASERAPGPATDSALLHAVYADPSLLADIRPDVHGGKVRFSPDGDSVYISPGLPGAPVVRYEPATGALTEFSLDQGERAVYPFLPVDDRHVVHSFSDGFNDIEPLLRLVDTETGEVEATAELTAPPFDIVLSPDGQMLVVTTVGAADRAATVEAFEVPSLEPVGAVSQPGPTFDGPWASASAWVDDDRVAVGSPTGRLLIWRPSTGEVVQRLNDPPTAGNVATDLKVTDDGSTLVAVGSAGGMLAFDLATGRPAWPEARPANPRFAIDERHGVIWAEEAGFGSSKAVAFDVGTGEPTGAVRDGQHGSLCDVVIGDDDRLLVLSSCNEESVSLWSLDGGTATARGVADVGAFTGSGNWTDDGSVVVNEGGPGGSFFVDLETGARRPFPEDDLGPTHFAPDRRRIRFERTEDRVVVERPGEAPRSFDVPMPDVPENMAVALDGSVAAIIGARGSAGPPDTVTVIDVDGGRLAHTIESDVGGALSVAVSPDGSTLVVAGGAERAELYDVETAEVIGVLDRAGNAAYSPDGLLLATNAFNGTIAFYDADSLEPEGEPLTGATAFTNTMQFTADGRVLVTAGLDNTLRFWDVTTREQLGPGIAVTDHAFAVAPEGAEVAASTPAGVQRFTLERAALREAACRIAGRELSPEEWERHLGGEPRDLCGT